MNEETAVSIVCTTYNHEKYIQDALDGFLMQKTSFPVQIIVHDDASTDQTANIIRACEQKNPNRMTVIYQTENQHSKKDGSIRRILEEQAKGKYIALCEGDDYWTDPYKLQKQYDFMEAHPDYTLCGCSTYWHNELTGKMLSYSQTKEDRDVSLEEFIKPSNGRPFPTVSFFIRADIWKTRPRWNFPVGDLPLTYYAAMQGKVRMLADNMCVYRWYAEGSWTMRNNKLEVRAKNHLRMVEGFETMNRETNYQYDTLIQKNILVYRYIAAKMNHDFKALQSGELGKMYHKRSLPHRIMDRICCKSPKLYMFIQKIRGRKQ